MRSVPRLPVAVALGASAALLAVLVLAPGGRTAAVGAYFLALGVVALSVLARMVLRASPGRRSEFERALRSSRQVSETLRELTQVENDVIHGAETYGDFRRRLQPLLWEIAVNRLRARHGIDPAQHPELARAALGDETWNVLRPDGGPTVAARGLPRARLRVVVDRLEAL
jgi:hypothetical protein